MVGVLRTEGFAWKASSQEETQYSIRKITGVLSFAFCNDSFFCCCRFIRLLLRLPWSVAILVIQTRDKCVSCAVTAAIAFIFPLSGANLPQQTSEGGFTNATAALLRPALRVNKTCA